MTVLDSTAVTDGVSAHRSAGTPSPLRDLAPETSEWSPALEVLEFRSVLGLVAGGAAGPLGAARVLARRPDTNLAAIRAELAPIAELLELFAAGGELEVLPVPELDVVLSRLRLP